MTEAVARRTDTIGATVDLVVLAPTPSGCVGIDADSGALVRAVHLGTPARTPHPFDVVRVALAEPLEELLDPSQPEALAVSQPEPVGRLDRRTAERLVRPLLHPRSEHVLGTALPELPYWELDGTRPSVSILEPRVVPRVRDGYATFEWRGLPQCLPLARRAPVSFRPGRLVVAFTEPRHGRCAKEVLAVLPR